MKHRGRRAIGLLLIAAGLVVSFRSESRIWYGAVLVGLYLLAARKSPLARE